MSGAGRAWLCVTHAAGCRRVAQPLQDSKGLPVQCSHDDVGHAADNRQSSLQCQHAKNATCTWKHSPAADRPRRWWVLASAH